MIPKSTRRETEASGVNDAARKSVHFEFIEDIIVEAVSMFEKYYKMVVDFTPNEVGPYLKKVCTVNTQW